ncbi:MAG TPA: phospholipase [Thermoanaerobaculia bacterium]|jgi:predicted esterase|nr:phospholipase [Thermoanaerobaculia bacterium]
MEAKQIATLVHGTYLVELPATLAGAPLLVGFHGYGENAATHLAELARIPGASRFLLGSVQALHPFYNKAGEVVASWMTRHDRLRAIEDNVRYVAAVVARLQQEYPVGERLVFAGFSQGSAMAYRAAARSGHPCRGVIVLGGDVPPELAARELPGFPPVLLGRGAREQWYDEAKMAHDVEVLRAKNVDVRPFVYPGGHEWTDEFRQAAGEFLNEVCP